MPRYNLTALRLYIGALACSVPSPVRYSQARTFSTIITTIQMKENIVNTSASPKETRSVFVGAKVTPSQRDHIKSLAEQCGMTVSDYILSCAYNFKPKARLTKEEAALLQNLDNCRSDLVNIPLRFMECPQSSGWLCSIRFRSWSAGSENFPMLPKASANSWKP